MIRFVTRPPGPGDTSFCRGALGPYLASFYGCGRRFLSDNWSLDYPGAEEQYRRDQALSLYVGLSPLWGVDIYWLDGYDNPPIWDRGQYFSALVPGVPYSVERMEAACKEGK